MHPETKDALIEISQTLRQWIHDVNNSLFVTKGFLEELHTEIKGKNYLTPNFDSESFEDMLDTVIRNVDKIEVSMVKLRTFVKDDIFIKNNITPPQ